MGERSDEAEAIGTRLRLEEVTSWMSGREAELKRSRPSASDKRDACRALGSGLNAGLRELLRDATAGRCATSPRLSDDNIDSSGSVEVAFAALDRFGPAPAPEKV